MDASKNKFSRDWIKIISDYYETHVLTRKQVEVDGLTSKITDLTNVFRQRVPARRRRLQDDPT